MAPPAEITIPTTSLHTPPDGSAKPYTLYNITLRLPLRTFVVQKRYSDFAALHSALIALVGGNPPPPAPLPAKSWFRSTVSSPELTEDRRRGLEAYLRAVAESPDRRWRDTAAWRGFLGLPSSSGGGSGSASSVQNANARSFAGRAPNRDAANAAAARDPGTWLDLHGEMKRDFQEARRCLARRDAAVATASASASSADNTTPPAAALEAATAAKKALVKAGGLLTCLRDGLKAMEEDGNGGGGGGRRLGEGEIRRRKDLLASARVDREDLDKLSSTVVTATARTAAAQDAQKAALLGTSTNTGGGSSRRRVLGAPALAPETQRTRELDNVGVAQLQRQLMDEQDEDVGELAKIIRRQREMALQIDRELGEQDDMLDALGRQVDVVGDKVRVAKGRVGKIS
ncbi:Phox homologous domain-containing protein [Xylariaceae sp. FL0804]|nr:Phox homologous domain-containing protein [Xylariaceae sp. FL0804]